MDDKRQHINQLFSLIEKKQYAEAIQGFSAILQQHSNQPDALFAMALINYYQNNITDSITWLKKSLLLPKSQYFIDANMLLGVIYQANRQYLQSIELFNLVLKARVNSDDCLNRLGYSYEQIGDLEKATHFYQRAVAVKPQQSLYQNNLAVLYQKRSMLNKAVEHFKQALQLNPNYHEARFHLGFIYLLQDHFDAGWPLYESRLYLPDYKHVAMLIQHLKDSTLWQGHQELKNKSILLLAEQGFGDFIQAIRFSYDLKMQGAKVYCQCPEPLKPLFQYIKSIDGFIDMNETYDFHLPVMSLMHRLNINNTNINTSFPYIVINDKNIKAEEYITRSKDKLNIGFCWRGRKEHPNDQYRSLDMKLLAPFFKDNRIKSYSLQLALSEVEQELIAQHDIIDLSSEINDFADTAKFINSLDLIITVDTSIVHLAGALNKRCWLFLPTHCDWRWGMRGEKTWWYKSVKIFRQTHLGDWDDLFSKALLEIDELKHSKDQEFFHGQ